MKAFILFFILCSYPWQILLANENVQENEEPLIKIRLGLEVTPGLLQVDGDGLIDRALREIENKSSIRFKRTYLSYTRAKIEMEKGNLDLIGLTPHRHETKSFYKYARELDWNFSTNLILLCSSEKALDLKKGELIGTLSGNEEFVSEIAGVDIESFREGSLESILLRVKKKRIPCVSFEEISTLKIAMSLKMDGLYFRKLGEVRGSFAIMNKTGSDKLKKTLEDVFNKVDWDNYLKGVKRLPKGKRKGKVTF